MRVLHVDDEPMVCDVTRLCLERGGRFKVDNVHTAEEALILLKGESYACVISDYEMPSMNGLELLKEIRTFDPEIPFILFSGRGREAVIIDAINTGADFYIQKGGDAKSLFAELNHKVDYAISKRNARLSLKRRDAILEAVSLVATLFLGGEAFHKALTKSINLFGLATEVDRVLFFNQEKTPSGERISRCICTWNRIGEMDVQKDCVFPQGSLFSGEDTILHGDPVIGSVEIFSDISRNFLQSQDIKSLAAFPVFAEREVRGMIWFCDCLAKREWAVIEIDALQAAASIIGLAIHQHELRSELIAGKERYASMYSMMHQLCDTVPDMLWAKDTEDRFIFVNKETSIHLLGYADTDAPIGKKESELKEAASLTNRYIPDKIDHEKAPEDRIKRNPLTHRFEEIRIVDGHPFHIDIIRIPFFDMMGDLIGTVAVGRDVTEERERARIIKLTQEKYDGIFHQVHIGLITCLPSGEVTEINCRAAELLEMQCEEIEGIHLHSLDGIGDGIIRDFSVAQVLKVPVHGKDQYTDNRGGLRILYYGIQPLLDEASQIFEVLITLDEHYQD
jgi:PAS domain S-box-containing protein